MAHLIKRFLEITNNAHFSSVTSRRAARGMSVHSTSLAKCAMMVTLMMVMGVGSVWGQAVIMSGGGINVFRGKLYMSDNATVTGCRNTGQGAEKSGNGAGVHVGNGGAV